MEESADIHDWELIHNSSDSDDNAPFEQIIRSDYFAIDPNNNRFGVRSEKIGPGGDQGGSFLEHGPDLEVGFEGIEAVLQIPEEIQLCRKNSEELRSGGGKVIDSSKMEVGFGGIGEVECGSEKRDSFRVDGLEMEGGFEGIEAVDRVSDKAEDQIEVEFRGVDGNAESNLESIRTGGDYFLANDFQVELGVEDSDELRSGSRKGDSFIVDDSGMGVCSQGTEEEFGPGSENEDSFLANRSEMELGPEGIERDQTEVGFGGVEGSEGSNSEIVPVGEGEKKGTVWWKLPMEILKFYVFRMRPIWSIPIAAAVIAIVMMGRRLYRMKHKNRRIPLKVSFEDKKAAAKVLLHAARLNEAVVRRVPVVRSPLLPASGMTPWPLLGLL